MFPQVAMKNRARNVVGLFVSMLALLVVSTTAAAAQEAVGSERPRNVIVFVADGMGFAHLAAARATMGGSPAWERFPVTGWHHTHAANELLTDSAASATALSSGHATFNGAIGVDAEGEPVTTLLEQASQQGYRTGIVTDSYIWDATPASFVAHADDRGNADAILRQLSEAELELLVGELDESRRQEHETRFGQRYRLAGNDAISMIRNGTGAVAVLRPEGAITDLDSEPDLAELTAAALDRMGRDESPFVLLLESEEPDSASHGQDYERMLRGMAVVNASLSRVLDFAAERGDTLVVFTSDHETGGLSLHADEDDTSFRGRWNTSGHTGSPVPIMAFGPGQAHFAGVHTNQAIGRLLMRLVSEADE